MKKIITLGLIMVSLAVILILINKVTYSIYKSNTSVNVESTAGNLVCNAVLADAGKSEYGYKKLSITINNFETVDNEEVVTDVPLKYNFTLSGPSGSKFRVYEAPANGRVLQGGQGFSNTNSVVLPGSNQYDEFPATKSSKEYIVEVMTSSDGTAAQEKQFSVQVGCAQILQVTPSNNP